MGTLRHTFVVKLKRWWRRIRGLCVNCSQPIRRHGECHHCRYEHLCHSCGKFLNHAKNYMVDHRHLG